MARPLGPRTRGSGPLPPTTPVENIGPAIAVHIGNAEPVSEALPVAIAGDRREGPLGGDVVPVRRREAKGAAKVADDLRLSVSGDVREGGRFVVHRIEDMVPLPMLVLTLWVEVKIGRCARQAGGEDVIPAVAVEVVNE